MDLIPVFPHNKVQKKNTKHWYINFYTKLAVKELEIMFKNNTNN